MTTIAYRSGVLAGDTRLSDDNGFIWSDNIEKVFKLANGALIGMSGDSEAGEHIIDAARKVADKSVAAHRPSLGQSMLDAFEFPTLPDAAEVAGILVLADGTIYMTEGTRWSKWPGEFIAIGNGKAYAVAAMDHGASAVEAVWAGFLRDCHTGGRITTVQLDPLKDEKPMTYSSSSLSAVRKAPGNGA